MLSKFWGDWKLDKNILYKFLKFYLLQEKCLGVIFEFRKNIPVYTVFICLIFEQCIFSILETFFFILFIVLYVQSHVSKNHEVFSETKISLRMVSQLKMWQGKILGVKLRVGDGRDKIINIFYYINCSQCGGSPFE